MRVSEIPEIIGIEVSYSVREGNGRSNWQLLYEDSAFALEIAAGLAVFRFKYALSSFEEAQLRVHDFLQSWEGDMLLQTGPVRRCFEIAGCRAPGHRSRGYSAPIKYSVGGALAEQNTRMQTPWRRHRYWGIPIIDALVQRYEDYLCGRERLTVLGYLCLTALEYAFDGRKPAAIQLKIDLAILKEFGRLVSTVGSYRTARKIYKDHPLRELTPGEEHWVLSVTRQVICRAGEVFSQRQLDSTLTMEDLPAL